MSCKGIFHASYDSVYWSALEKGLFFVHAELCLLAQCGFVVYTFNRNSWESETGSQTCYEVEDNLELLILHLKLPSARIITVYRIMPRSNTIFILAFAECKS